MNELYELIRDIDRNKPGIAASLLDKDGPGEKLLISDGIVRYASHPTGFLASHRDELSAVNATSTIEIEGKRIFCDSIGSGKRLVICGGGHVAIPVVKLGCLTGFEVILIEDREEFANNAKAAGADRVILKPYKEGLDMIQGDMDTFFVVVTRGHKHDLTCMDAIMRKPHAYAGMIGSRAHGRIVREALLAAGIPKDQVEAIHNPIGLNISSETPEEIAVSIIAEIIQVKNQTLRNGGYPKDILAGILGPTMKNEPHPHPGPKALATIVYRKGSAPRDIGTKMVVFSDGTIAGTIGGGLAEALTIKKAKEMITTGITKPYLYHSDMTNEKAEEDGMVCGGIMDILIEPLD